MNDKEGISADAVSVVIPDASIYIPFEDLVDAGQEIERLEKEEKRLAGELKRSESMLGNERFLSKAPQAKIDEAEGKTGEIHPDDGAGKNAAVAA